MICIIEVFYVKNCCWKKMNKEEGIKKKSKELNFCEIEIESFILIVI